MLLRRFGTFFCATVLLAACRTALHDPDLVVEQAQTAVANGNTLYESEPTRVFVSVLSMCRDRLLNAHADGEDREANDPFPAYANLDDTTRNDWAPLIARDSIVLQPKARFRVVASVKFRCTLPHSVPMSAYESEMNGSDSGSGGAVWSVAILSGKAAGRRAVWDFDDNTYDARTKLLCFPKVSSSADECTAHG